MIYAAHRADALLERGDVQGYEVWLAILAVLESARAALHAEISAIRSKAGQLFSSIGQGSGMSSGAIDYVSRTQDMNHAGI